MTGDQASADFDRELVAFKKAVNATSGEVEAFRQSLMRTAAAMDVGPSQLLDNLEAWYREHAGKVWLSEIRAHSHTNGWMRSEWSAPADTLAPHLWGALWSLGLPVRVDDTVPSGILRIHYTDGTERDERVYGDLTAFSLALRTLGKEIVAALHLDALANWLNRRLARGERRS